MLFIAHVACPVLHGAVLLRQVLPVVRKFLVFPVDYEYVKNVRQRIRPGLIV